jgi:type II secretory pathway component PulJ
MGLADLLTSLVVLSLVLGANLTLLEQGRRAYAVGSARVEAQQNARIALARMARDIRTAGAGTANLVFDAVSVAEPARIVFHRDVNVDGIPAGRQEMVVWRLDRDVLRRDAGGGGQPIVNGVRAMRLTYLDASGEPTTSPARIRTVSITLTVTAANTSSPGADVATTVSTQVRLRNR